MKKVLCWAFVLTMAACLFGAGAAFAQMRAGAFTLSPMAGGYSFDDERDLLDLGRMYTLGMGYNFNKFFAAELGLSYIHTDADLCCGDDDVYAYQPRLDFLFHLVPDARFVPYLAVGGGGLFYDDDNLPDDEQLDDSGMVNGGLGVKYFMTDNIALRVDGRYNYLFEDSNNDFSLVAGITFQLGGEAEKIESEPRAMEAPAEPEEVEAPAPEPDVAAEPAPAPAPEPVPAPEPEVEVEIAPEVVVEPVKVTVYFDSDSSRVKQLYHKNLQKVGRFLKQYPDSRARIEGHTDSKGKKAYNMELSRRRAESVKSYLVNQFGVAPYRFDLKWYGESRPVADNSTPEGRQLNRRAITITIME